MRNGGYADMLSQTAQYALRAALCLARAGAGQTLTADTIATALGAPANYMSKTLHALAKTGIVEGVRGPSGGFRLLISPSQLSVARIVEAFDEPDRYPTCLIGHGPCDPANPCVAHTQWSAVIEAMHAPLQQTMLTDLMESDSLDIDLLA
jgi:Rrf2 family transcriptional regulator, iron-sulfur cluster assembly transcription factor